MKAFTAVAVTLTTLALVGCGVHQTEAPPLTGPSRLALSLNVSAIPDSISQDGGSQSSVKVTAIGPDGKPVAALPLRMDMMVGLVATDFGTLSARSVVTNNDGVATVVYTAPPAPPNGVFTPCPSSNLPGSCVSIVATATATNFLTANPESVLIRLVPPGVIVPPATTLIADFVVSPASPAANSPAQFDASKSCGGPLVSGSCPASAPSITSYVWNFGDGQTGTGQTVSHSFALQQPYTVTLTITNALGASAPTFQVVTVGGGSLPTPLFTVSPQAPVIGQTVFFNALTSTAGEGHTIASYRWNFGDGVAGSGQTVSHAFTAAGSYLVQLTVTDESGQAKTSDGTKVDVVTGNPTAVLLLSKIGGNSIQADGCSSTATGTSSISSYRFIWGDSTPDTVGATCSVPHAYGLAGAHTVTLIVTDNATPARTGSTQKDITTP